MTGPFCSLKPEDTNHREALGRIVSHSLRRPMTHQEELNLLTVTNNSECVSSSRTLTQVILRYCCHRASKYQHIIIPGEEENLLGTAGSSGASLCPSIFLWLIFIVPHISIFMVDCAYFLKTHSMQNGRFSSHPRLLCQVHIKA